MNKALSFKIRAEVNEIEGALDRVLSALEEADADLKATYQIRLALDELLTNVVSYAYEGKEGGEIEISYEISEEPHAITIALIDEGKAFDPLQAKEPDLSLNAEERTIGGLGIFLVKKTMDDVSYRREGNKNILTLKKTI